MSKVGKYSISKWALTDEKFVGKILKYIFAKYWIACHVPGIMRSIKRLDWLHNK